MLALRTAWSYIHVTTVGLCILSILGTYLDAIASRKIITTTPTFTEMRLKKCYVLELDEIRLDKST